MDAFLLKGLAIELDRLFKNSRLIETHQIDIFTICFLIKGKQSFIFQVSVNPSLPYIFLADFQTESSYFKHHFVETCEKRIKKSRVKSVEFISYERILYFDLEHLSLEGNVENLKLYFEFSGKNSNIILVDDRNKIVDALRYADMELAPQRPILPGFDYYILYEKEKINPERIELSLIERLLEEGKVCPLSPDSIFKNFLGISPHLAKEISNLYQLKRKKENDAECLFHILKEMFEKYRINQFQPVILKASDKGSPILAPFPLQNHQIISSYVSIIQAAGEYYRNLLEERSRENLRVKLLKRLKEERKKVNLLLEKQKEELDQTTLRERYRRWGELILANLSSIPKGSFEIMVDDIFEILSKKVKIPLNPALSAIENAQNYFKLAKKSARGKDVVIRHMEKNQKRLAEIEEFIMKIETSLTMDQIIELQAKLAEKGIFLPKIKSAKKGGKKAMEGILQFVSSDGLKILVGKNAQASEKLLSQFSSPEDFWFHTKDVPGAHIIVKNSQRLREPPIETAFEAARLAASHSSLKEAQNKITIIYTKRKYVKKIRGAEAGKVIYKNVKTILV